MRVLELQFINGKLNTACGLALVCGGFNNTGCGLVAFEDRSGALSGANAHGDNLHERAPPKNTHDINRGTFKYRVV